MQLIVGKGCDPVIVFAFGKTKCEKLAKEMEGLQLNTKEEAEMVEQIFRNAVETLTEDDQSLPQVTSLLPMVMRGVAVHHSGLLPTLKELVEILFQVWPSELPLNAPDPSIPLQETPPPPGDPLQETPPLQGVPIPLLQSRPMMTSSMQVPLANPC